VDDMKFGERGGSERREKKTRCRQNQKAEFTWGEGNKRVGFNIGVNDTFLSGLPRQGR